MEFAVDRVEISIAPFNKLGFLVAVKLREARLAQEKYREQVALQEAQFVVAQMSELRTA